MYRHQGKGGTVVMLKYLLKNRSFKITFWFRIAKYFSEAGIPLLGPIARRIYRLVTLRYCVDMPLSVQLGKGLLIYHAFGLVIHSDSVIGDNVMLSHQVTLATEKGGAPIIGNRVRISPGAKIVGGVTLGDGVVVGANSVVIKNVPPNCVTVGVPNRILERPFEEFAERYFWKNERKSPMPEVQEA